jgi:hypothetical protein
LSLQWFMALIDVLECPDTMTPSVVYHLEFDSGLA